LILTFFIVNIMRTFFDKSDFFLIKFGNFQDISEESNTSPIQQYTNIIQRYLLDKFLLEIPIQVKLSPIEKFRLKKFFR